MSDDRGADKARLAVSDASKGGIANRTTPTLRELVTQSEGEIGRALPMGMDKERFVRLVLTELRKSPKLMECTPSSFMGAVLTTAQLGLEFGAQLGQAYMLPFRNHGTMEVQLIVGYKGWLNLIDRNREIASVSVRTVRERDKFDYEYGLDEKLVHKPADGERGPAIGYYCVIKKVNGGRQFEVMTEAEVQKHMRRYAKSKDKGPWSDADQFEEMAKKTVFLKAKKWLPVTADVALASAVDEMVVSRNSIDDEPEVEEFNEDDAFDEGVVDAEIVTDGDDAADADWVEHAEGN